MLQCWRICAAGGAATGLLLAGLGLEFFTAQSNVLVIAYLVVAIVRAGEGRVIAPRLRGAVTSWILITGVANAALLADGSIAVVIAGVVASPTPSGVGDLLLHYVVPLMMLVEWILVRRAPSPRWRDALLWTIYPLVYLVVVAARSQLGADVGFPYPYPFLDPTTPGWPGPDSGLPQVVAIMVIVPFVVVGVDRLLRCVTRPTADRR